MKSFHISVTVVLIHSKRNKENMLALLGLKYFENCCRPAILLLEADVIPFDFYDKSINQSKNYLP